MDLTVLFDLDENGRLLTRARVPQTCFDALQQSIAKWAYLEKHWKMVEDDGSDATCGLCRWVQARGLSCFSCPVYKKTGQEGCDNTPYRTWVQSNPCTRSREAAACSERIFLESLVELARQIDTERAEALKQVCKQLPEAA